MGLRRLKIAQVATTGISVKLLLLDQIKALEAEGHEVTAVCAPGPFADSARSAGVKVDTIPMEREIAPMRDLRSLLALARYFRQQKFAVVHTHTPKAGLIGPLAAQLAGVPLVVHTVHGLLFHDRMPRMKQIFLWMPEKITATFCDCILSQSQEDVERAVSSGLCRRRKISYIGNGIDVARFAPQQNYDRTERLSAVGLNPGDFVVGSVGRLVKEKGFMEFFAAAEVLTARHPQLKFLVIGPRETDQNDALDNNYMDDLQRRGVLRFVHWSDDMRPWYAAMDLFVLPSYREGIPRACMEASAMMRPVVASDIRGCREVVLDGETGLLAAPRDVLQLVAAIETLYQDRNRAAKMGERGRQHIVRNFNNEDVCRRLCEFYTQLSAAQNTAAARENPVHADSK